MGRVLQTGMTGLEQALSIIQMTLVEPGHITWADVARIMSETPAKIAAWMLSRAVRLPKVNQQISCWLIRRLPV